MRVRILATISLGLLSAACQGSYSQNAPGAAAPAYGNIYQSSNAACADYGFHAGTTSFNQCVAREQQARATGRVNRDYAATQLTADARSACSSYGLAGGTAPDDRCVSREVDARTYRDGVAQPGPAYYTDQNGNRVDAQGYRVDANGHRMASQSVPVLPVGLPDLSRPAGPDLSHGPIQQSGRCPGLSGRQHRPPHARPGPDRHAGSPGLFAPGGLARRIRQPFRPQGNRVDASGRVIAPQRRY